METKNPPSGKVKITTIQFAVDSLTDADLISTFVSKMLTANGTQNNNSPIIDWRYVDFNEGDIEVGQEYEENKAFKLLDEQAKRYQKYEENLLMKKGRCLNCPQNNVPELNKRPVCNKCNQQLDLLDKNALSPEWICLFVDCENYSKKFK